MRNKNSHEWTKDELDKLVSYINVLGPNKGSILFAKEVGITKMSAMSKYYYEVRKGNVDRRDFAGERDKRIYDMNKRCAERLNELVSNNPNNLRECFRTLSAETGMSVTTIAKKWYGLRGGTYDYSSSPMCRRNIGDVFCVVGKNSITVNGKNQSSPTSSKRTYILAFIKRLFKIKDNEKTGKDTEKGTRWERRGGQVNA